MYGGVGGWVENEFLKKTPSPKIGLESQLGTSDLEFVKTVFELYPNPKKFHCTIPLGTVMQDLGRASLNEQVPKVWKK